MVGSLTHVTVYGKHGIQIVILKKRTTFELTENRLAIGR